MNCRFFVGGKRSHGLIGADDPDVSELLCKQIKLEQPDIDDQSVDTESMLPEEACTLVAEFRDDTESIVPDDAIAGNAHPHKIEALLSCCKNSACKQ
jgi:hypothetical protein